MVPKLSQLGLGLMLSCSLWLNCSCSQSAGSNPDKNGTQSFKTLTSDASVLRTNRSIIAPPANGIYLGQTTFKKGEVRQLEQIVGEKIAIVADYSLTRGSERGGAPLRFDLARANHYADSGYVIFTGAYEAYPGHTGFTVDRLLRGDYDHQLAALAAQFRQFRGQMFFATCREPNGVLRKYFGGFGPNGDKSLRWAIQTGGGFTDFHPPPAPLAAPNLYAGLGRDDRADGIERLGAAQRYYYDFFIRREGLSNLTFDTMGWGVSTPARVPHAGSAHKKRLEKSLSLQQLLAAIGPYYDWISINWYLNTESEAETGFRPGESPQRHRKAMQTTLDEIAQLAPNHPILITELGILEPYRKQKAIEAWNLIKSSKQIKGVIFWGAKVEGNPFDAVLRSGEPAARILQAMLGKYPGWSQPNIRTTTPEPLHLNH